MHKQEPIETRHEYPERTGMPIGEFMSEVADNVRQAQEEYERQFPCLTEFVKEECQRLPYYPDDPDADLDNWFNQQLQKAFPEIVETMSKYDLLDNGIAVQIMMERLHRLVMWKPISPIEPYEKDPSLWCAIPIDDDGSMQSRRCPALFYYPNEDRYSYMDHAYYNEKDPVKRQYDSQYTGRLYNDHMRDLFYPYLKKMGLLEKQSTSLNDVKMPFYPPDKSIKIDISWEELNLIDALNYMAEKFEEWKKTTPLEERKIKEYGRAIQVDMIRPEVTIFPLQRAAVITLNLYRYDPTCGNRPDLVTSIHHWADGIYVPEDMPGYLPTYAQNCTTAFIHHVKSMANMARCYRLPCFVVSVPVEDAVNMGLDIKLGWMMDSDTYDHKNSDLAAFCHNEFTWIAFGDKLDIEDYSIVTVNNEDALMFTKQDRAWCDYYLKIDEYRKHKWETMHEPVAMEDGTVAIKPISD